MRAQVRLLLEMLGALAIGGLFLRELYAKPLIESTRAWPRVVLACALAVAAFLALSAMWGLVRGNPHRPSGREPAAVAADAEPEWPYPGRRYALMAAFALYVLALPVLGYAIASALFIPVGGIILGMPPGLRTLAFSVAMALAVWVVFVVLFNVPMPEGLLPPPPRLF